MHLLEIGATQPAFGKHLGILGAQTPFRDKVSSRSFFFGNENGFFSAWKLFGIGKNLNFNFGGGHERRSGGALLIKAVATLEPKSLVCKNDNKHLGFSNSQLVIDKSSLLAQTQSLDEDSGDLEEKERLRRTRISKANKGNTPWNKGKKHSPETLQRIRERTRLAMQHPKVKMKLVNLGHAQTEETRVKIGYGVRKGWERRRKKLRLQETCYFEWQNLVAEASRKGYDGESELQWNSYEILNEKLKEEWLESVEMRKSTPRPKGSKRATKSPEQRRKISEAISRKWADTAYRERVVSALAKYHGIEPGAERKTRKRPSDSRRSPVKKATSNVNHSSSIELKIRTPKPKLSKSNAPSYKDPLASSKLEMIKNIRAQRASVETKKIEAVERAKLLIAEAEKAAKALEAAATKSPIARASLIETRKLIAEAIRSIKSIETEQISSRDSGEDSSVVQDEPGNQENPPVVPDKLGNRHDMETDSAKEIPIPIPTETSPIKVNGTRTLAPSSKEKDFSFGNGKLSLEDTANGNEGLFSVNSTTGFGVSPKSYNSLMMQSGSVNENGKWETKRGVEKQEKPLVNGAGSAETLTEQAPAKAATVTKKWVRGRLVEVAEGAA